MNDEQGVLPLPEIEVYSAEELIRVEYILFAFHHLCRSYPQFLVLSENLERLKNLRSRFAMYFNFYLLVFFHSALEYVAKI